MTSDEPGPGDLLDPVLSDEIELVSDLVVAASASPRHFTPEEVDVLLGVQLPPSIVTAPGQPETTDPGTEGQPVAAPEAVAGG